MGWPIAPSSVDPCVAIEYHSIKVAGVAAFETFAAQAASIIIDKDAILKGGKGKGKGSDALASLQRPLLKGE
eukprot:7357115-Lingulodinium_polyedra.AAC.1